MWICSISCHLSGHLMLVPSWKSPSISLFIFSLLSAGHVMCQTVLTFICCCMATCVVSNHESKYESLNKKFELVLLFYTIIPTIQCLWSFLINIIDCSSIESCSEQLFLTPALEQPTYSFWYLWFRASCFCSEIIPTRCNNCGLIFPNALLYMFQVTIPPIIRSTCAVYGHR